ncbi:iron-containing alcohol dehydrogenase [Glaciecola sp. 2405UD65-10]|uniref:iron-containing alcohol dehydrogenase n=1 Tax=Glaciecola sp. 2405UD65-10 TaxID=3397244 RepID=UPI003B5CBD2C
MNTFQFDTSKRIVNEVGGLRHCPNLCKELGVKHVIIVSDKGLRQLGMVDELAHCLQNAGVSATVFDKTVADPPDSIVLEASAAAIESGADGVIGIGGGSSMDCAKLVSVLVKQQQSLSQMFGLNQITGTRAPLILIPTTAGTGSEVTPISIVTTGETTKAGIVSHHLLPDVALLDASLTLDLPAHITAATGIDAMVHAIEAYTSKIKKNPYSDMLAKQALLLLSSNIEKAVTTGKDLPARQQMMFGACLAGQAFANAPVGGVHALAYPLGGHFHIPHGLSNALVLPHVLRFNASHAASMYGELAAQIKPSASVSNPLSTSEDLAQYFEELLKICGLPTSLKALQIPKKDLTVLAQDAMLQERLLVNNPKHMHFDDALNIYEQAY